MKINLRTQAVIDAFKKRTSAIDPELRNRLVRTEDYNYASYVIGIEQLVREIIKSNKIFFIGKNELGRHTVASKNPDFLEKIYSCITSDLAKSIAFVFPMHNFNPYVDLFIKNANDKLGYDLGLYLSRNFRDVGLHSYNNEYDRYDDLVMTVDMLNEFIDRIRRKGECPKFKKLIANYQSNIIKNNRGLVDYINYLFNQHSSLLVLRVDFGYTIYHCKDKDEIDKMYEQAQKDRKNFINDKPNSIFEHRVGYAWKLEYCRLKGFYYQMFFFFDGTKMQLDINRVMMIGEYIGEYWKTTITEGKGLYFNYNDLASRSRRYPGYPGIGMINRDDHNRRNELEKAVGDLMKPDYYAKIDAPGKEKTFSRGEILKP